MTGRMTDRPSGHISRRAGTKSVTVDLRPINGAQETHHLTQFYSFFAMSQIVTRWIGVHLSVHNGVALNIQYPPLPRNIGGQPENEIAMIFGRPIKEE